MRVQRLCCFDATNPCLTLSDFRAIACMCWFVRRTVSVVLDSNQRRLLVRSWALLPEGPERRNVRVRFRVTKRLVGRVSLVQYALVAARLRPELRAHDLVSCPVEQRWVAAWEEGASVCYHSVRTRRLAKPAAPALLITMPRMPHLVCDLSSKQLISIPLALTTAKHCRERETRAIVKSLQSIEITV